MILCNAIFIHNEFNRFLPAHMAALAALRKPMSHCLYYGSSGVPPKDWHHRSRCLGCADTRDNLPLKVYGICKDALTMPEWTHKWTHLFKTDVNVEITRVDWAAVEKSEYVGCVVSGAGDRQYMNVQRESLLREPWLGKMPKLWCGGSGWIISRRVAEQVVKHGAWEARGSFAEEPMVANAAAELGVFPLPAVAYRDKDGDRGFTFP